MNHTTTDHVKKLEKKRRKLYKKFKNHPKSKYWDIQILIASNKLTVLVTRTNKHGYPFSRKKVLGLKDKIHFNRLLK